MRSAAIACVSICLCACAAGPDPESRDPEWSVVQVDPTTSLRGLCVVSPKVLWVSGSRGVVQKSVDGGVTWSAVGPAAGAGLDFRSIAAIDERTALVASAGDVSRVYRTADGGASWTLVFEDPRSGAFFDAMVFATGASEGEPSPPRAYLLGDPIGGVFQLFVSDDSGLTFEPRTTLPTAVPNEAMFAASCSCLCARGDEVAIVTGGAMSRALRSHDGGRTWGPSMLPLQQGKDSQGAFSVAFTAGNELVAVGGDYKEQERRDGVAAYTDDGGRVWRASSGLTGYRSGVAVAADGATCVAVGPLGASWSRDAGATWSAFGNNGFHAVAIAGSLVVAVGQGGRIGITRLETRMAR